MINHQEYGLSIRNCAKIMATYDNCGQGSHGKIEPAIPTMHSKIHIMQQNISIFFIDVKLYRFCVVKCS